ncbi:unnamed protein product [Clavelina lepadiformis]|uniref:HDAg domain-containing protein n=1 Tax=Clavelina lepadiformis TaxID=159417 RepID=A0ABP0G5M0_CLALP
MAHVRDSDTALWLHNKLGSAEELWIPSSISGIVKTTTIDNIYRCFPVLTTTVKLKLLMGILHLPRRNLEEMKHTIEGIVEIALSDSDVWVKLIANIVKTYPMEFNLNLDLRSSHIAQNVIQQLTEKVKEADTFASLPLECQLVNKTSLQSLVGSLPPLNRHFALKRKPKSASLRADLLQKSSEAVSQMRKGGTSGGAKSFPVKHRDMARRSSDVVSSRRTQAKAPLSRTENFRATQGTPSSARNISRVSGRQQAGGTKLLDISEQPIGGSGIGVRDSKRRKKLAQQESVVASQSQEEEEEEKPANYADDLPPAASVTSQGDEVTEGLEVAPLSHARRSTAESTEPESSTDEEMPPNEIQPEAPQQASFLDTSKATSSESEISSPIHSTSSSQEDIRSPIFSQSVAPTLQSPIKEAQKHHERDVAVPPSVSHVVSPQRTVVQPLPAIRPSQPSTAVHHAMVQHRIPQQGGVQNVLQNATYKQLPQQAAGSTRMYAPNTFIMAQQQQPAAVIRTAPTVMVQHHQQPRQQAQLQNFAQPTGQTFYRGQITRQQQQQQIQPQQQPQQAVAQQTVFMKQPQQLAPPPPKKGLTLTREQMFEAQEMFQTANRLSRPEKALILGFMAGSRENPHPEQGDVVRVVLSEEVQSIQNPSGVGLLPVIVETVFEMNYRTGQSAKHQRFRAALTPSAMNT